MEKNRIKNYFIPAGVWLLLFFFFLFISTGEALAAEKKKKKKKIGLELRFGLATTYDDNILKYSEKYLDRFMEGLEPGRFQWIDTYDDLIINPSIEGIYTFNIFKKVKTKINASISPKFYVVNEHKNWYNWGIGIQQYITKKASVKILYSYIPNFYVRHFRDEQWTDVIGYGDERAFTPYEFSKDNFGIYAQNTFFKRTRVKLSLYHARYYHNESYTEYDSKDWLYGVYLYQGIGKKIRLDAGYQFVTSDTYRYPEVPPDATFEEDRFTFGVLWRFPKVKKRSHYLDVDFHMLYRYYASEFSPLVDALHVGRVDKNYRVYATYNISITKPLRLSLYYNWLMRDTDTKALINSRYVSNEKDYHQNKIGFKLVYSFKL